MCFYIYTKEWVRHSFREELVMQGRSSGGLQCLSLVELQTTGSHLWIAMSTFLIQVQYI